MVFFLPIALQSKSYINTSFYLFINFPFLVRLKMNECSVTRGKSNNVTNSGWIKSLKELTLENCSSFPILEANGVFKTWFLYFTIILFFVLFCFFSISKELNTKKGKKKEKVFHTQSVYITANNSRKIAEGGFFYRQLIIIIIILFTCDDKNVIINFCAYLPKRIIYLWRNHLFIIKRAQWP